MVATGLQVVKGEVGGPAHGAVVEHVPEGVVTVGLATAQRDPDREL